MPLCDGRITSFFKPVHSSHSGKDNKQRQRPRDCTKRARDNQDPATTDSNTNTNTSRRSKKAKYSLTQDASLPSTDGLTDLLPVSSPRPAIKDSPRSQVIDLTDTVSIIADDLDGASAKRTDTPLATDIKRGILRFDSPMTKSSFKQSALPPLNPATPTASRIANSSGSRSLVSAETPLPAFSFRQHSVVPSSQSQRFDAEYDDDELVVPSSQTQYPSIPNSPSLRSPRLRPSCQPFSTPRKARTWPNNTSPTVPSSQTQALCLFDSPNKSLRVGTQPPSDDSMSQEVIPSSQSAEERELSTYMGSSQLFPRHDIVTSGAVPPREGWGDTLHTEASRYVVSRPGDEPDAPTPVLPSLADLTNPLLQHHLPDSANAANTQGLPPDGSPVPQSPERNSQVTDGALADESSTEYSPTQHSLSSTTNTQDDLSGDIVIGNFFSIFGDDDNSLPADFPIPLR